MADHLEWTAYSVWLSDQVGPEQINMLLERGYVKVMTPPDLSVGVMNYDPNFTLDIFEYQLYNEPWRSENLIVRGRPCGVGHEWQVVGGLEPRL